LDINVSGSDYGMNCDWNQRRVNDDGAVETKNAYSCYYQMYRSFYLKSLSANLLIDFDYCG
jgi:hypothetical protein